MLTIPKELVTDTEKLEYSYRVLEKLRFWYNDTAKALDPKARKDFFYNQWLPRNKSAHHTINYYKKLLAFGDLSVKENIDTFVSLKTASLTKDVYDKSIDIQKVPRLTITGEPPDPLEDFLSYTKVDPNSRVTITTNTVSYVNMSGADGVRVYKDMGAGFFSGSFTHSYDFINEYDPDWNPMWSVQTGEGDFGNVASGKCLSAGRVGQAHYVHERSDAGGSDYDYSADDSSGVRRYIDAERDENVGTYGTVYVRIYTDASRTTLFDTISEVLDESNSYQYVYAKNNHTETGIDGDVSNLDLHDTFYKGGILKRFDSGSSTWKQSKLQVPVDPGWGSKRLKLFVAEDNEWKRIKTDETE